MSTFHGLEMARQALASQQTGLYITGHNISNINTEGYSRQRVNFETLSPYPSASRNRPQIPGQLGTGVRAGTIERMRDQFLDARYRTQNSETSYWQAKSTALSRMEGLMNEISGGDGLNKIFDDFWQSLQDLSTNAENSGARSVVGEKAKTLAETFNYIANSLETIRTDLKSQIGNESEGKIGDANSLLRQINALNKEIAEIEPHGMLPNDLYDRRDNLIDQLSSIVDIKVTYKKSATSSLDIADGIAEIELVDDAGMPIGVQLLSADDKNLLDDALGKFSVDFDGTKGVSTVNFGKPGAEASFDFMKVSGSLKGLIENYGYMEGGNVKGSYPDMLANLDKMAVEFAKAFNDAHGKGYDLSGNHPAFDFFTGDSAKNIGVNQSVIDNPSLIAASEDGTTGNGKNALALGKIITDTLPGDTLGKDTSVKGFYQSLIGKLAVTTKEANSKLENTTYQQNSIQNDRLSVSAVSLDDEVTNLLKFQHAYNAAARSMTTMDEMLDKVINSMGLVGR